MKTAIPYILTAILTTVAILLLMRACNKTAPLPQVNAAVDSVAREEAANKKAAEAHADSLEGKNANMQDSIDNLNRQMAWYEAQMSSQGGAITQTLNTFDSAQVIHDTVAMVIDCDTLVDQVKQAKIVGHGFRVLSDSLISALTDQGRIKDSISATWKSAFLHADTAQAYMQSQYNVVYKKLKTSSFTEKILGGAAAALLLGLLIKK